MNICPCCGQPIASDESVDKVLKEYNRLTGRNIRTAKGIKARLARSSVDDCISMMRYKWDEWAGTEMQKYFRPETLFSLTHYETYVAEAREAKKAAALTKPVRDPNEDCGEKTVRFDIEKALSYETYLEEK